MKKHVLTLVISTISLFTYAQPSNATVFDCDTNSRTIFDVLGTGKSVIVLSKGVDCSICKNAAPGWQTWASNNKTTVEVWGAITYLYNPNNFSPECTATNKWITDYSWNDIFTFPDSNRSWYKSSTPRYYVYSAIDSTITYQGSSSSSARSNAIAQSTVGLKNVFEQGNLLFSYSNHQIQLKQIPNSVSSYQIIDVQGRTVKQGTISGINASIQVGHLNTGAYVIQLFENKSPVGHRKMIFY